MLFLLCLSLSLVDVCNMLSISFFFRLLLFLLLFVKRTVLSTHSVNLYIFACARKSLVVVVWFTRAFVQNKKNE